MASTRTDGDRALNSDLVFVSDDRAARVEKEREASCKRRSRGRGRRKARETGSKEDVRGAAQTPSAPTVEELADSFSEQLPGRSDEKGKSPVGILVEEKDLDSHRRDWESSWGGKFGLFRDYTCVRAMLFTSRPTPPHAGVKTCLQIFSMRITKIDDGLELPLEVYGLVATRDSVDHNRTIIFRRGRDACQFVTEQGSLMLTGPSRAIVFTDPVDIEIQLKVKSKTESEDKDLISTVSTYIRDIGSNNPGGVGNLLRTSCSSEFCSLEVTSTVLPEAVEATVITAELIQGRWPKNLGIRVVSGTASIDEDFVLLDARDGKFKVDLADGVITLTRHIVCVEKDGRLKLSVEAYKRNGDLYERSNVTFLKAKRFSASIGVCKLAFCTIRFTVGWSCLASVGDLMAYGI